MHHTSQDVGNNYWTLISPTFGTVLWRCHHCVPLAPLRADKRPPAGLGQLPSFQLGKRGNLRLRFRIRFKKTGETLFVLNRYAFSTNYIKSYLAFSSPPQLANK